MSMGLRDYGAVSFLISLTLSVCLSLNLFISISETNVHVFLCVFHSKALLDCNNKFPHCLRPNKWKFKTSLAASPPSGLKFSFQSDFQPKWEESDSCSAERDLDPRQEEAQG